MARPFYYGGQALIEGVLIRGRQVAGVAVRRPNGHVWTDLLPLGRLSTSPLARMPLVRGVVVLLETLLLGMRALNLSAEIAMSSVDAPESGPQDAPKVGAMERGALIGSLVVALAFGIGLFFLLPLFGARSLGSLISSALLSNLVEGFIRLGLLVGYIWGIGYIRDIRRVFAYHGAEHMTIHAHEHGDPLDVDHISRYPTAHPRCGTAFLLTVVVVSILVFALLGHQTLWMAALSRVLLVPVIAAISYELIRFSGAHAENPAAQVLMLPGLALQRLTTRQPDATQIEVAVAAMARALAAEGAVQTPAPSSSSELPREAAPVASLEEEVSPPCPGPT